METLVCRGCHVRLQDEGGCALCEGVKPHIVPVGATSEDEATSLSSLAQETTGLLRRQLRQLLSEQKVRTTYDPSLAHESRQHANVLAKLLDSARKVIQEGAEAVQAMSLEERCNLFVEWFQQLPTFHRRKLLERLHVQVEPAEVPLATH